MALSDADKQFESVRGEWCAIFKKAARPNKVSVSCKKLGGSGYVDVRLSSSADSFAESSRRVHRTVESAKDATRGVVSDDEFRRVFDPLSFTIKTR